MRFWLSHAKNIGRNAETEILKNIDETGKKSVKSLVKKGRDLELSEPVESKEHLKEICKQFKKQGVAFAIKEEIGNFRILYQRKDGILVNEAVKNALKTELNGKKKTSLTDILKRNKNIEQSQQAVKTPVKQREVDAR